MPNYVGQRKRVRIALEVEDVATDGTVACTTMAPDGTVTSQTVVNDTGSGAYHSEFTLSQEGRWFVRVTSTGDVIAAAETYIDAAESVFV